MVNDKASDTTAQFTVDSPLNELAGILAVRVIFLTWLTVMEIVSDDIVVGVNPYVEVIGV